MNNELTKEDIKNDVSINDIDITQEKLTELMAKTGKLGSVWNRVDGLILGFTALGCVYLLTMLISSKTKISAKKKLLSAAGLGAALLAIPVIISLFDPCGRAIINYIITQRTAAVIILTAAVADVCIEGAKKPQQ